jgi:hypothetical protein
MTERISTLTRLLDSAIGPKPRTSGLCVCTAPRPTLTALNTAPEILVEPDRPPTAAAAAVAAARPPPLSPKSTLPHGVHVGRVGRLARLDSMASVASPRAEVMHRITVLEEQLRSACSALQRK